MTVFKEWFFLKSCELIYSTGKRRSARDVSRHSCRAVRYFSLFRLLQEKWLRRDINVAVRYESCWHVHQTQASSHDLRKGHSLNITAADKAV